MGKLKEVLRILKGLPDEDAAIVIDLIDESTSSNGSAGDVGDVAKVVITKLDDDNHIAFGWANVPIDKDGIVTDSQGDQIDLSDLEENVYLFNLLFREGDEMHTEEVKAHLIESMIVTPEKIDAMATRDGKVDTDIKTALEKGLQTGWWAGWYVPDDDVWAKVKDGTYKMFSIGGMGTREPANA